MICFPGPMHSFAKPTEGGGGIGREGESESKREGEEREKQCHQYLSSQSDDTGEVALVFSHTLKVAENTLELGSLRCHSPLTAQK